MIHAATIVYTTNRETYVYRDRDHQQECVRRLEKAQPTAAVYAFTAPTLPAHVTLDLR